MIVPDLNLLQYAYDSQPPIHARARSWWRDCLSGSEAVGRTHAVVFGFLRVGTSRRVDDHPWTMAEAAAHIQAWTARRA